LICRNWPLCRTYAALTLPTSDAASRASTETAVPVCDTLQKAEPRLRRCLEQAAGEPVLRARVSMVVGGEGQVEGVFVVPGSTQACVEPVVREHRFPATRTGRQQVVHVIHSRALQGQQAKAERQAKKASKVKPATAPRSKLADSAPAAESGTPAPAAAPVAAPAAPAAAKP
jgi:hypothetical protein